MKVIAQILRKNLSRQNVGANSRSRMRLKRE
jgi:hypothetical protein